MFDPAHDVERRHPHEPQSRQLKTKERRHTDEAQEQRELEELIVDTYWNSMDTTLHTSTTETERADYLNENPPDMDVYGKTMKTFSALLLSVTISCSMIPQKDKLYNYIDQSGQIHVFREDLYKLRETEYWYCYQHETLHELKVYQVANNDELQKIQSMDTTPLTSKTEEGKE